MSLFIKKILLATFLFVSLFLFKNNAYAETITMPPSLTTDTSSYVLLSSSGTIPSVSDFSGNLMVTLSVTNGTIRITTTTGLSAPSGYNSGDWAGASEIAFDGSQTDVNNALATLAYQGDGNASTTLSASATPTGAAYNPGNGHYYIYVNTTGLSWTQAKAAAAATTFNGLTGYLATITSAEENAFMESKTTSGDNVFIGATDSASEGVWIWDTGPEAGTQFWAGDSTENAVGEQYSSWGSGEPSDGSATENYTEWRSSTGAWNDVGGDATGWTTYIIEYGGLDGETATVDCDTSINITSLQDSAPTLLSLSPTNNATDVPLDTNLVLTFDKAVDAESGNVSLYKSDNSLFQVFNVASDISGSGTTTITIDPTSDLVGSETYYIQIDLSAFDDTFGNSYAGINDSTSWRFSTTATVIADSEEEELEIENADIDSWRAYLYDKPGTSCPVRLRLEIKGDDFENNAKVKIGGSNAYAVDVRNKDEKIIARFCLEDLLKVKTSLKRVISVTNPSAKREKAKNKINLAKVSYKFESEDFTVNNPGRTLNIQKALVALGFLDSQYTTGYYGTITSSAMRTFQATHGLEQTGELDLPTEEFLLKKFN